MSRVDACLSGDAHARWPPDGEVDAAFSFVTNTGKFEINIVLSFKVGFGKVGTGFGGLFLLFLTWLTTQYISRVHL